MKIAFIWNNISGYMASCWTALSEMDGVDVAVCAYSPSPKAPFSGELVANLNCRLLSPEDRQRKDAYLQFIDDTDADIYVLGGWGNPIFPTLAPVIKGRGKKVITALDTPYLGKLKQKLTRFRYPALFKNTDMFAVTGERSYQYAQRLNPEVPARKGLYGVQSDLLARAYDERCQSEWPKSFLYIGRYAKVKGLDVLTAAYRSYRDQVEDPWPLVCCGTGPLESLLNETPGVDNRGFCQPEEIVQIMRQCGVFTLASNFDPWPLVIVEACNAGLPVICTEACGSAVENVRSYYNGITVRDNSREELADSMRYAHDHYEEMPLWGQRSINLSRVYGADFWAQRWHNWALQLLSK